MNATTTTAPLPTLPKLTKVNALPPSVLDGAHAEAAENYERLRDAAALALDSYRRLVADAEDVEATARRITAEALIDGKDAPDVDPVAEHAVEMAAAHRSALGLIDAANGAWTLLADALRADTEWQAGLRTTQADALASIAKAVRNAQRHFASAAEAEGTVRWFTHTIGADRPARLHGDYKPANLTQLKVNIAGENLSPKRYPLPHVLAAMSADLDMLAHADGNEPSGK